MFCVRQEPHLILQHVEKPRTTHRSMEPNTRLRTLNSARSFTTPLHGSQGSGIEPVMSAVHVGTGIGMSLMGFGWD